MRQALFGNPNGASVTGSHLTMARFFMCNIAGCEQVGRERLANVTIDGSLDTETVISPEATTGLFSMSAN